MTYTELVKRLRDQVECDKKLYPQGLPFETLLLDLSANAIEELSKRLDESIPKGDAEIIIAEVAKPRWIPVTERLPENFKAVLVYTPKYLNQFMAYRKDDGWRVWSPQDNHGVPFINGQGEITHWMALPEPPKEET